MNEPLPEIWLVRHGETAWSRSGRHTGRTDLPLTEQGQREAVALGRRLSGHHFTRVFTSPSQRATRTCELAGFSKVAQVDNDLAEWDYGDYEGLRTDQILRQHPDWQLFRDGGPHGESVAAVSARADRVLERLRAIAGDTLLFSSGHFLRALTARFLGLDASAGRLFTLQTASLSILAYEHTLAQPSLLLWNEQPGE